MVNFAGEPDAYPLPEPPMPLTGPLPPGFPPRDLTDHMQAEHRGVAVQADRRVRGLIVDQIPPSALTSTYADLRHLGLTSTDPMERRYAQWASSVAFRLLCSAVGGVEAHERAAEARRQRRTLSVVLARHLLQDLLDRGQVTPVQAETRITATHEIAEPPGVYHLVRPEHGQAVIVGLTSGRLPRAWIELAEDAPAWADITAGETPE